MKNVFFVITLILFSTSLFSQESKQKAVNTEKEVIEEFFKIYKEDTGKALDYLYSTNVWIMNSKSDQIKLLRSQLNQFQDMVGDYIGYEYIGDARLGKSFSSFIYLVKYDRQPVRFSFEFYKPRDKWIIYAFKFDDSFNKDFEEAIKYRYLNQF